MRGRIRRRITWITEQAGHTRRVVRDVGWKVAVGERLGAAAAKSPQWREREEAARTALDHVEASARRDFDELQSQANASRARLDDLQMQHEAVTEWRRSSDARHVDLNGKLENLETLTDQLITNDLPQQIAALRDEWLRVQLERDHHIRSLQAEVDHMRAGATSMHHILTDWLWAANAPLPGRPLISVIMTTAFPEREPYLRSAIDSVFDQTYGEWELIVVDDAVEPFLDPAASWWRSDPRIRIVRGEGLSEGRARNVGLGLAVGEVVAYLDDDCRWFPWWLHAVARAFSNEPDIGIVHGIRVVEADPGGETWTYAQALDSLTLHVANPADTNVMAHRTGLPNSDWPDISSCADYDTVIRLSGSGARYLPVPAATYAVTSPSRAWAPERAEENAANFRMIQSRARRTRPLRIVAHNGLYPLLSETYIGDELEALRRRDIDIVLSRDAAATVDSPRRVDAPLFESLADAISAHDPDLVLMHWAGVGLKSRAACGAAEVPYGIRMHSFDGGVKPSDLIDEWCAGIWNFPHHSLDHGLAFPLDTLIIDPGSFSSAPRRGPIVSLSAGLPKKDFANLVHAMQLLPDIEFDVVMATTNGFETLPAEVRGLIKRHSGRGRVIENMPYETAQVALRSTAAFVYSLAADQYIGQPRSILEAAIAGAPLVLPRDPAIDVLVGATSHRYDRGDPTSLARAIGEALESPRSLDERAELSRRVTHRHAGEKAIDDWATSVSLAVVGWQRRRRTDREGANLRWWWPS